MEMVKDMERKVIKTGNSLGANMTDALKKIGAEKGDTLSIEVIDHEIRITKKQPKIELPQGVSEDFFKVLESTADYYDKTLKGLKDR
ncbi:AbrB/MazE/SpoVT family DNA-binding domain-containing protein [Lentibacillus salinarum]|uniref:AbrB family transcriptional regulator n=1 Tax=Lentibacillus salinarum TaxID=446820 RepID=A0ABW3ZRG6_9BACI